MTSLKLIAPPALEPVTLADMKAHARIDADSDDALLTGFITAARQWAENYVGRAFVAQTWRMTLDDWPEGLSVELPRPPLLAVESVRTFDADDASQVWAADNYYVDTISEPGRVTPRACAAWPVPGRALNGVEIDYVAGYGSAADDVPEAIRLAIKQLATHWYEHRGEAVIMSATRNDAVANLGGVNVPYVIQALLDPYRLRRLVG